GTPAHKNARGKDFFREKFLGIAREEGNKALVPFRDEDPEQNVQYDADSEVEREEREGEPPGPGRDRRDFPETSANASQPTIGSGASNLIEPLSGRWRVG